jgi:hypothetical protein
MSHIIPIHNPLTPTPIYFNIILPPKLPSLTDAFTAHFLHICVVCNNALGYALVSFLCLYSSFFTHFLHSFLLSLLHSRLVTLLLRSAPSGILCSVEWSFCADVSGQPICPIFKGQEVSFFFDFLTFEDGTDRLSRNVGTELYSRVKRSKSSWPPDSKLLILEDGTDTLTRNVGKGLPHDAA